MNNAINETFPVVATLAQPGFAGRHPKYRIAWSMRPEIWHPDDDARSASFRDLADRGLAGVEYVRTTDSRDDAVAALEQKGGVSR